MFLVKEEINFRQFALLNYVLIKDLIHSDDDKRTEKLKGIKRKEEHLRAAIVGRGLSRGPTATCAV